MACSSLFFVFFSAVCATLLLGVSCLLAVVSLLVSVSSCVALLLALRLRSLGAVDAFQPCPGHCSRWFFTVSTAAAAACPALVYRVPSSRLVRSLLCLPLFSLFLAPALLFPIPRCLVFSRSSLLSCLSPFSRVYFLFSGCFSPFHPRYLQFSRAFAYFALSFSYGPWLAPLCSFLAPFHHFLSPPGFPPLLACPFSVFFSLPLPLLFICRLAVRPFLLWWAFSGRGSCPLFRPPFPYLSLAACPSSFALLLDSLSLWPRFARARLFVEASRSPSASLLSPPLSVCLRRRLALCFLRLVPLPLLLLSYSRRCCYRAWSLVCLVPCPHRPFRLAPFVPLLPSALSLDGLPLTFFRRLLLSLCRTAPPWVLPLRCPAWLLSHSVSLPRLSFRPSCRFPSAGLLGALLPRPCFSACSPRGSSFCLFVFDFFLFLLFLLVPCLSSFFSSPFPPYGLLLPACFRFFPFPAGALSVSPPAGFLPLLPSSFGRPPFLPPICGRLSACFAILLGSVLLLPLSALASTPLFFPVFAPRPLSSVCRFSPPPGGAAARALPLPRGFGSFALVPLLFSARASFRLLLLPPPSAHVSSLARAPAAFLPRVLLASALALGFGCSSLVFFSPVTGFVVVLCPSASFAWCLVALVPFCASPLAAGRGSRRSPALLTPPSRGRRGLSPCLMSCSLRFVFLCFAFSAPAFVSHWSSGAFLFGDWCSSLSPFSVAGPLPCLGRAHGFASLFTARWPMGSAHTPSCGVPVARFRGIFGACFCSACLVAALGWLPRASPSLSSPRLWELMLLCSAFVHLSSSPLWLWLSSLFFPCSPRFFQVESSGYLVLFSLPLPLSGLPAAFPLPFVSWGYLLLGALFGRLLGICWVACWHCPWFLLCAFPPSPVPSPFLSGCFPWFVPTPSPWWQSPAVSASWLSAWFRAPFAPFSSSALPLRLLFPPRAFCSFSPLLLILLTALPHPLPSGLVARPFLLILPLSTRRHFSCRFFSFVFSCA